MDFGMPVLIENKNIQDNIALCKDLGLSFIELNMNLPEYQAENLENTGYFKKLSEKAGIYFTIHLDENLNIADFNESVADAYMKTVARTIKAAKLLNIPVINMHINHGVHFTLPDRKVQLFEEYFDIYIKKFQKFKDLCEASIGSDNIKICIENTDGFKDYEKSAIEMLLKSSVFALTWDIGHSNSCQNIDEEFIMQHKDQLRHFHIHDSAGKKDHMTLGTGEIDLKSRIGIAKEHNCRCVIETKTVEALKESVLWLRENLKEV